VLVSGAGAELEEETVLYKRPREHMWRLYWYE
jgi:hypothetical protein